MNQPRTDDNPEARVQPVPGVHYTYETRIIISGGEDDTRMAAVKLRAFIRRCHKPRGLRIRLAEEWSRLERSRG